MIYLERKTARARRHVYNLSYVNHKSDYVHRTACGMTIDSGDPHNMGQDETDSVTCGRCKRTLLFGDWSK